MSNTTKFKFPKRTAGDLYNATYHNALLSFVEKAINETLDKISSINLSFTNRILGLSFDESEENTIYATLLDHRMFDTNTHFEGESPTLDDKIMATDFFNRTL